MARWIYQAFWTDKPDYSPAHFEALLRDADDPERIPLSLLAVVQDEPAGTVNLIVNDDSERPQLTPWLAALYVAPSYRNQGTGAALVTRLCQETARIGYREVYFGTRIPGFYEALGARIHEQARTDFWVMRIDFSAARA